MSEHSEQAVAPVFRSVAVVGCSLLLVVAALVGAAMRASPAVAKGLTASYRCAHLIPVQTLKTVTGRKYVPSPGNANQHGSRINCVFTPLPRYPLPPAMRHAELTLTVSSQPADAARLRQMYAGRLHPLTGLGSSAIETVSSTGMQQIVAIGPGFALTLRVYGPMGFVMEEKIGRHIYAAAAS